MGYDTYFMGDDIKLSRPLTNEEVLELSQFIIKTNKETDFGFCVWDIDTSNLYLYPTGTRAHQWDEWLKRLVDYFFKPKGVILNGYMYWEGDERSDIGEVSVDNNVVSITLFKIVDPIGLVEDLYTFTTRNSNKPEAITRKELEKIIDNNCKF